MFPDGIDTGARKLLINLFIHSFCGCKNTMAFIFTGIFVAAAKNIF
jgi:hypothetical protein